MKVNDDDTDDDGIPDFADGYDPHGAFPTTSDNNAVGGESFTPMSLTLARGTDYANATLKLDYFASVPNSVTRTGDGTEDSPYVYTPFRGRFRVWTKDGYDHRDGADVKNGGDFIMGDQSYTADELGLRNGGTLNLFIEGIRTATDELPEITAHLTIGDHFYEDPVQVTVAPALIRADANRDGAVTMDAADDRPFYFWTNTDRDRSYTSTDDQQYEYDVEASPAARMPDSRTDVVDSARDLEDFFRVRISVPPIFKNDPALTMQIRWESESGNAAANAYFIRPGHQVETDYLSTPAVTEYIVTSGVSSTGALELCKRFGGKSDVRRVTQQNFGGLLDPANEMNLLVEGVKGGNAKLVVLWVKNKRTLIRDEVRLKLNSIETLYDEYSNARGPGIDPKTETWMRSADPTTGGSFQVATTATQVRTNTVPAMAMSNDYILWVHGWNMPKFDRDAFAQTAFKRLYWSGFKGHFASFSWPSEATSSAPADPGNFDRSEYIAWESAEALRSAIGQIRTVQNGLTASTGSRKLSVLAHSMGSMVVSEALTGASAPSVDNVIYTQAAISSDYFDASLPDTIYKNNGVNPLTTVANGVRTYHGLPTVDGIGGPLPRFSSGKINARRLVNFYNQQDYALTAEGANWSLRPSLTVRWWQVVNNFRWSGNLKNTVATPLGTTWTAATNFTDYRYFKRLNGFMNGPAPYAYDLRSAGNGNYSLLREWQSGWTTTIGPMGYVMSVPAYSSQQVIPANPTASQLHEAFAFLASPNGVPIGRTTAFQSLSSPVQIFDDSPLNAMSSDFDNTHAGHSAQFYRSMASQRLYWKNVKDQSAK